MSAQGKIERILNAISADPKITRKWRLIRQASSFKPLPVSESGLLCSLGALIRARLPIALHDNASLPSGVSFGFIIFMEKNNDRYI